MRVVSLFFGLFLLFFCHIGWRPLANPDEGRYASIGLDILRSKDWIVPRLNGLIYFEKPPLGYWAIALGQKFFGNNVFGARFFNALFSLLTCCGLYLFCRKFLSQQCGVWAAVIYGTAALPFGMSQMLTLDNTLTFFLTITLLLFASGFLEENLQLSRRFFLWAYIFMGLTILAKGLIGIVIPGVVGLPWIFYTKYIKRLSRAYILKGIILVFIIAAPWHFWLQKHYDCFFNFYFWHEHFERYLTSVHARTKPWYFLLNSFLLGLIPWILFLPRALKNAFKQIDEYKKNVVAFSLIWSFITLLFFSCSHSQLIPYILPAISGITIALAYGMTKTDLKEVSLECFIWSIAFLSAACTLPFVTHKHALTPVPNILLYGVQILLIIGSLLAFAYIKRRNARKSFFLLLTITLIFYLIFPLCLPYFQRLNAQHVCQILKQKKGMKPLDVFCAYNYFNDVPFYLGQPVGTIDCIPEEHRLGYQTEGCGRYITNSNFRHHWIKKRPCYAIVERKQEILFEANMKDLRVYRLTEDAFFVLYCNQL